LLQLEPSFAEQHTEKPNGAMVSLGLTFKWVPMLWNISFVQTCQFGLFFLTTLKVETFTPFCHSTVEVRYLKENVWWHFVHDKHFIKILYKKPCCSTLWDRSLEMGFMNIVAWPHQEYTHCSLRVYMTGMRFGWGSYD
jgi:hypothetical protein